MPALLTIPALRQSAVETAACPRAYVEIHINGKIQPDSIPSERGTEIHRVMSEYVRHCTARRIPADWETFNSMTEAAGPVAGPILDGIRDNFEVDWQRVADTEVTLRLTEDFEPCAPPVWMHCQHYILHSEDAAYEGTLDVILLSEDGLRAKISDYKSHPSPFDADTFQATLYCFMLLKHLPDLQVVTFELNFVRYTNCLRAITFRREDMPAMQAAISRARQRQLATHENPDAAMALPCKTCNYCPLMKNLSCPIREWNEYTVVNAQQRYIAIEFNQRAIAYHRPLLKSWVTVNGPVSYPDGNGVVHEYGHIEVPSTTYPLDRTLLTLLDEHKDLTGEDMLDGRFNVSSTKFKSALKTNKRTMLREKIEDSVVQTTTKPQWASRRPEGVEAEFNPYEEE